MDLAICFILFILAGIMVNIDNVTKELTKKNQKTLRRKGGIVMADKSLMKEMLPMKKGGEE